MPSNGYFSFLYNTLERTCETVFYCIWWLKFFILHMSSFPEVFYKKSVSWKTPNSQINTRSSHPEVFCQKKDVLKNFAKFTEKHFCHSLFLNKVAGWKPETFSSSHWRCSVKQGVLKKVTPTKVFPCEFCKLFKNSWKVYKRLVLKHQSQGVSSIKLQVWRLEAL